MAQFVEGSQIPVGSGKGSELSVPADLAPPRPSFLAQKWQAFLAGPRLRRGTALVIIELVALFFWVGVAVGIYHLWRHY